MGVLSRRLTLWLSVLVWLTFLELTVSHGQSIADLECEVKKAALSYGAKRVTGNIEALERGLNFLTNCSHAIPRSGVPASWRTLPQTALKFYVSPDGNDANPGTLEKPFQSVAQARDAIRFQKRQLSEAGSPWPGAEVNIMEGKYFFDHPLHLSSEDSGTPDGQIVYQAYRQSPDSKAANVVLSGGVPLNLTWQKSSTDPRIYMAHVPNNITFTTLFVNGVRQIRARSPNGDPQQMSGLCYYQSQEPDEGCSAYAQTAGPIKGDEHLRSLDEMNLGENDDFRKPPASPSGAGILTTVGEPTRPHHITGDNHWPSFHYLTGKSRPGVPGFKPVFSFWNNPYHDRATGAKYNPRDFNRTWKNPGTGIVHMFHTQYWGNWMFQLASQDSEKHEFKFAYGGWQEARGASIGQNHFYVENIFEELDSPGEWFHDVDSSMLYFYPNETQCPDLTEAEVVAPQHASLVKLLGSWEHPVSHVTFQGLTFTETRTTYMDYYEVPSGGDWSIYQGASFFLQGAEHCEMNNNTFTAVGGNAIFLSAYVRNCTVSFNEITLTGDSAIASVGRSGMIDGMQPAYPAANVISNNHIHDFGMYGKQVSCYFQAVTCGNLFKDNVCYNGPRAGINFNDGFGGASVLTGNLIFNMVRETDDHGMFNSWDRQPYITPAQCTSGPPSIIPAANHIDRNFIINGYAGRWAIDHDDGSAYYNNTRNFMIFGGVKAYLGHDKMTGPGNVIVYPGIPQRSAGNRRCQCDDNGEFADQFYYGNQCFSPDGVFYTWRKCNPDHLGDTVIQSRNNQHYSPGADFKVTCGSKTYSFKEWQAAGQDFNSSVHEMPSASEIVAIGMAVLGEE